MNLRILSQSSGAMLVGVAVLFTGLMSGCSHSPQFSKKAYAENRTSRQFEYEMQDVWKAIEKVVEKKKVLERDPNKVDAGDWGQLRERSMELDWSYGQSRDKYKSYVVNSIPKQQPLGVRVKYSLVVKKTFGGATVEVVTQEEIEDLDEYGVSKGYFPTDQVDSSRAAEILDQIANALLAASARPLGQ
jgi:hypothetical protein